MAATLSELAGMYARGDTGEYSHMIIKVDAFDYEDYPIYVKSGDNPREIARDNGDRTMECYSYALGWEVQSKERRANHWEH
jgi:hypothetical protein